MKPRTRYFFFEKTNKFDNSLARFMKKKREKTTTSIMNERGDRTTYPRDFSRVIRGCYG